MRLTSLLLALAACAAATAQTPPPAPQTAPAPPPAVAPSTLVRPSLDTVTAAVNALRTDRWKRGSIRDEAAQDVGSILTDIRVHLPPLLAEADLPPMASSKQVAVVRNVDALYDVLLRVFDAARIAGPGEDVDSLQQALNALNKGRLALYDRLAQDASAQEKIVAGLRSTIDKQAAQIAATPAPVPCPTPAKPVKKKKKAAN